MDVAAHFVWWAGKVALMFEHESPFFATGSHVFIFCCRILIDGMLNAASYAAEMGDEAMRLAKAADAAVAAHSATRKIKKNISALGQNGKLE